MKNFFYTLFGGLAAILAGMGIAYGGANAWDFAYPRLSASSMVNPVDGTSISGLKRTIRYSGAEEEDLINAAAEALPMSPDSRVTATAYIVKNLTRGDVATERASSRLLPIASLTKLVTAVVADRLIDPDERVTITKEITGTYGNTASFSVGETLRARDLLYPLLMVSSNDAAEALAQDYGRAKFIKAMNDFVQSIGAYRTYFADPSGLSADNVSTAGDLAIILDWIRLHDANVIAVTALKSKTVRNHTWTNPTHFLSWSYYVGGKNGYTPEADRTGASLFALGTNKNVYAVVVLGSSNRDADVIKLLGKVKD